MAWQTSPEDAGLPTTNVEAETVTTAGKNAWSNYVLTTAHTQPPTPISGEEYHRPDTLTQGAN